MMRGLPASRTVRASFWSLAGFGLGQILRLAGNLVMTRLLFPEAFGLMALINVFIIGLAMFSDVGIGLSIVQNPRGDEPAFLNTAWTVQVIRGLVLWMTACLLAWPIALIYAEPQILWILPLAAFTAVIQGLASTKLFTAQRHMQVALITAVELLSGLAGVMAMVLWAWFHPHVLALVAGALIGAMIKTMLSHVMLPGEANRLHWDRSCLSSMAGMGRWALLNTAIAFIAMQSDRLVLGKMLSLEVLGVYSIAVMFAAMPMDLLSRLGNQVVFPWVSRQATLTREELRQKLRRYRQPILLAGMLGASLMVGLADVLIHQLYDSRYHQAGWMLALLSIGLWTSVLACASDWTLLALGKPKGLALGNGLRLVIGISAMVVGYHLAGLTGLVMAVAMAGWLRQFGVWWGMKKEGILLLGQDALATVGFVVCTAMVLGIRWWITGGGFYLNLPS
ncbi:MAG: oligosaccharide flippase family protein [Phycisphaerales bacterium]|nr:oligosaccharide flippase family protein [Phycisphaerales bacterium]